MRRFRSILVVPVTARPEPPPALIEAVALAESSGASVEILGHVPDGPVIERDGLAPDRSSFREAHLAGYRRLCSTWAEAVGTPDMPIRVVSGSQPLEVTRRVERDNHDLVVIAGDGSAESTTAARRVLRTCPCPVWLLRPGFTGARVLVAIDPEHGPDRNRFILELASSQAALHAGDLHVMHAWGVPGLYSLGGGDQCFDRDQLSALATAIESAHRASFEAALADAGLVGGSKIHLVEGPAARAIEGLNTIYRADLIVMGAGSWEHPQLGLGSIAEQVLATTESSVLVVRGADPTRGPDR